MKSAIEVGDTEVVCEIPEDRPIVLNVNCKNKDGVTVENIDPANFLFASTLEQANEILLHTRPAPDSYYSVIPESKIRPA